ncbi:MAG TPA: heme exporter protein CcmB [Candidatus Dormibacteraeota bacterium]|jgi:heme exporter protein B|nr:heme exporter protein CcmB [Candidatus Dormibacteraeota bacterium]
MRFAGVMLAVAAKDLRCELRGKELLPALTQFVVLSLVIAGFAFDLDASSGPRLSPGILWLVLVFAGLLAFGRTFAAERDVGSLEAMLLTPAGAPAIFAGKALGATVLLVACEAVLLPAMAVFLASPISPAVVATVLLATVGMAWLGCLFAALAAQTRARELLLPVLALPLWIPFVVVGSRAVQVAMSGGGFGAWAPAGQPYAVLLDFDILFLVVSSLAARFVLDD